MKKIILIFTLSILTGCNRYEYVQLSEEEEIFNPEKIVDLDYEYVLKGVVDGYEIYRKEYHELEEGETRACYTIKYPTIILNEKYSLPGGGGCLEKVYAVKEEQVYGLSGGGTTPIKRLDINIDNLCSIEDLCIEN